MCQAQQQPPTWDGPEMKREGRQIRQQAVDQFLQCQKKLDIRGLEETGYLTPKGENENVQETT
jgi:hypothetical protein